MIGALLLAFSAVAAPPSPSADQKGGGGGVAPSAGKKGGGGVAPSAGKKGGGGGVAAVVTRLERLVKGHDRIVASQSDLEASRSGAAKARGAYFPDLKATADQGRESIEYGDASRDTDLDMRHFTLTATQLLWDFGKTRAEVDKARVVERQMENGLRITRQDLLLEGISALMNLRKAHITLEYARQSVDNIRRQAGMEESRVELGSGFSTDVLQAKSQLAGAQARLTRANGAWIAASNRYRALFDEEPPAPESLPLLAVPQEGFPKSLEELLAAVLRENPQLANAALGRETAAAEIRRVRGAELLPKVNLVGEAKFKENDSGTVGDKEERVVKVEVTAPFNTGLSGFHALEVAGRQQAAVDARARDTEALVREQAGNAWQSLLTARENADFLANQARISGEFLGLAKEERLQGRRSLIDVLSGETSLINAQSDAAAAEVDVVVAAYSILRVLGRLELAAIR
ncbi:MAG: TolC family protein [Magnetococcales bacterium]|nr:TolC family protein [Magnetococcales bacterium]